jgi:nicotinamidase-related amidase
MFGEIPNSFIFKAFNFTSSSKTIVSMSTALLIMDMQNGITERLPDSTPLLNRVKQTIQAAHLHQVPVYYIVIGFRNGFPEISPTNLSFSNIKASGFFAPGKMDIHPDIAPQPEDIIITKKRVSAFAGSDLELILRSQQISHLVLTGISTSGVILSTVREAADKDYKLTVLSDGCEDSLGEEVHRVLTTKVFPRQAEVITCSEWINRL